MTSQKRKLESDVAEVDTQSCAQVEAKGRRVLITGASGLLGRQILRQLEGNDWEVRGLAFSRCTGKLVSCDLTQEGAVEKQIEDFHPDIVIHTAAERRPDAVHKRPSETHVVNVDVTRCLAKVCHKFGVWMVYISTDYVFDGTRPPYLTDAVPNPLSKYGEQKWEGERVTLQESPTSAVLRIPLIYGQMEYVKESAVTALYQDLKDGLLKSADHSQKRYPTYTADVAKIIQKMMDVHSLGRPLEGIFHWQADECLTKYDMVQAVAELQHLDASAVVADKSAPKFPRPEDSRLDCSRLIEGLDITRGHFKTPFRDALHASFLQYATDHGVDVSSSKPAGFM